MTNSRYPKEAFAGSAVAFSSRMTLAEMLDILQRDSGWDWRLGDNDVWGDYLRCLLPDRSLKLRLFQDDGRFVVHVSPRSLSWDAAFELVSERVLPTVGAAELASHPGWEG